MLRRFGYKLNWLGNESEKKIFGLDKYQVQFERVPDRWRYFYFLTKDGAENGDRLYVVLGEVVGYDAENEKRIKKSNFANAVLQKSLF